MITNNPSERNVRKRYAQTPALAHPLLASTAGTSPKASPHQQADPSQQAPNNSSTHAHKWRGVKVHPKYRRTPKCFTLWQKRMCMRSKAWLAASVWLRLASRARRSRRLRDTLAAAPGLLAHASVTRTVNFVRWVQNLGTGRYPNRANLEEQAEASRTRETKSLSVSISTCLQNTCGIV
jgi:hypothetical protein